MPVSEKRELGVFMGQRTPPPCILAVLRIIKVAKVFITQDQQGWHSTRESAL